MFVLLGIMIGFTAAIPLGPVNVYIASQTLKRNSFHGFLAASTTATLDFIYCMVALIGFFQVKINVRPEVIPIMKIIAGLIIIAIGYKLVRDSKTFSLPASGIKIPSAASKPIFGVLALYVTNPSLYIFWMAVAGSVTSHNIVGASGWKTFAFAASCGVGALIWYSIIVRSLSSRQQRIKPGTFNRILYVLGFVLVIFGVYTMSSAFIPLPKR